MRPLLKKTLFVCAGTAGLVLFLGLPGYQATQTVPTFYRRALDIDPSEQEQKSHEFLRRTSSLSGRLSRPGDWEVIYTAEEINGWLAVDLEKNHPTLLPDGVIDPRVEITPEGMTVACRYERDGFSAVFSLGLEPYLEESNVIALRIRHARIGSVPVPMDRVLQGITEGAVRLELPLEWKQNDGDPVACVDLSLWKGGGEARPRLETVELRESVLVIGGTVPAKEVSRSARRDAGAEASRPSPGTPHPPIGRPLVE